MRLTCSARNDQARDAEVRATTHLQLACQSTALRQVRKLLRQKRFASSMWGTDKLRSFGAAGRVPGLSCWPGQGLRQNHRAENSYQPIRRRGRKMQG